MTGTAKRLATLALTGIFSVSLLAAADAAQAKPGRQRRRARTALRLPKQYTEIAKRLGLNEEQTKKLAEILRERSRAERAWKKDPEKGGKLAELVKKLRSPEVRGDRSKVREIQRRIAELKKDRAKLLAKFDQRLAKEILKTPELQLKWHMAEICLSTLRPLRSIKLTAEQKKKIHGFCSEAAKKLKEAGLLCKVPQTREQARKRSAILRGLRRKIQSLLTPEQREQLKKKARRRPPEKAGSEKKEGGRKPRKKGRRPKKRKHEEHQ